ncbi:NAD(P)H-binding protein [Maribacter sp. CXY002]|uniref:NAD(P)H-binding protein n=1 Tax=Maribacter luteocoastalis TaxID=3407671 RepID=UPI003B67953F
MSIFNGNEFDKLVLETFIKGCDYVRGVLNISRNSDFIWHKIRTPKNYLSQVIKVVVPLAKKHSVKRLVVCSAWGVSKTSNDIPLWFRWLIKNSNIGVAYEYHERQEEIVLISSLDWTIIRTVGLTDFGRDRSLRSVVIAFLNPVY